jgi:hypothetical protein
LAISSIVASQLLAATTAELKSFGLDARGCSIANSGRPETIIV